MFSRTKMYKLHFKVVQVFQAATFSPQTGPYNATLIQMFMHDPWFVKNYQQMAKHQWWTRPTPNYWYTCPIAQYFTS